METPEISDEAFKIGGQVLVVVAAALAAFVLGPFITHTWQNHDRDLQVKSRIVGQMSDASAGLMVAVLERQFHGDNSKKTFGSIAETKRSYIRDFRTWEVARQDIASQIGSYFGKPLEMEWLTYAGIVRTYYNLVDDSASPRRRQNDLSVIEGYLGQKYPLLATQKHLREDSYNKQWRMLENDLIARRSLIAHHLRKAHVRD